MRFFALRLGYKLETSLTRTSDSFPFLRVVDATLFSESPGFSFSGPDCLKRVSSFFLPCHCYEGLVHLTRYFVFGFSGFYIIYFTFCSRSLKNLSPFCMRKTIIIAQLLTCEYERINKNDQLRFVSFVSQKTLFGENFGNMQCFPIFRCHIKAV